MKKPFYPILFAIFPTLYLFSRNRPEVTIQDLPLPILVLVVGILVFMLLLKLLTKNYHKIALTAFSFLIVSFLYVPVRDFWPFLAVRDTTSSYVLWGSVWLLIYAIPSILILRSNRNLLWITQYLNVVAIILLTITVVNIGIYQVGTSEPTQVKIDKVLTSPANQPDIYYIVLDEYARDDYLREVLGYDNELTPYLASKGFYIANKSRTAYFDTVTSLASSLNMEYIGDPELKYAERLTMMQDNKVSQLLKAVGYHYIFITSGGLEGQMGRYAEVHAPQQEVFGMKTSWFASYMLQSSTLDPFLGSWIGCNQGETVLYSFDKIANIPNIEVATFTFVHILSPRSPFVFNRDGNPIRPTRHLSLEEIKERYLDQLIFINKKVEVLLEEILVSPTHLPSLLSKETMDLEREVGGKCTRYLMPITSLIRITNFFLQL